METFVLHWYKQFHDGPLAGLVVEESLHCATAEAAIRHADFLNSGPYRELLTRTLVSSFNVNLEIRPCT